MAVSKNGLFGEERSRTTIRESIMKYFSYWPLIVVCLVLSISIGVLYSRSTVPKYIAKTLFLVKGSGDKNSNDLIEAALSGKPPTNLNNEILLIRSSHLMERTVFKNNFNVSYFIKGRLLNSEVYKDAPFRLEGRQISDSSQAYVIHITNMNNSGGSFFYAKQKEKKLYPFKWNEPFIFSGQFFVLVPVSDKPGQGNYIAQWQPVSAAAAELSGDLSVKAYDIKTSVIELSIKTKNLERGKDVLNALFNEFNLTNIEDRKRLSDVTVNFINERLIGITNELKGVEGNLENYQGSQDLVDIKGQSAQSLANSSDVAKTIKSINIQQSIVKILSEYFANPANNSKLVPSSLGLNDGTLASLITQYNDLQLKKERETPLVAPNSTVMQDLNTQMANLKSSILESLNNITKNLNLQEQNFSEQNTLYKTFLSAIPRNERVLQEIKRKQSITEGLYLYLLQKREESAISSTASNVAHYQQIDLATGYGPVEPNMTNIIMYMALLGLFIAFSWIYLREILNDKIVDKEDLVKRVSLPLLGEISHISKKNKSILSVMDRSLGSEQFRGVRTNLYSLTKNAGKKVILVTSSVSGEGKSFIALNLAAVCAIPGKKVALLEFDIRQPVIGSDLQISSSTGITSYLAGEITDISEISHSLDEVPSLHIYPCGPLPTNPADLLLKGNISDLFARLKQEYDYIIVDTSPAGLVSDPFVLGLYSDIVVFIIRSLKTTKKQLDLLNEMAASKALNNVTLILNDVKPGHKSSYYRYENSNGKPKNIKVVSKTL